MRAEGTRELINFLFLSGGKILLPFSRNLEFLQEGPTWSWHIPEGLRGRMPWPIGALPVGGPPRDSADSAPTPASDHSHVMARLLDKARGDLARMKEDNARVASPFGKRSSQATGPHMQTALWSMMKDGGDSPSRVLFPDTGLPTHFALAQATAIRARLAFPSRAVSHTSPSTKRPASARLPTGRSAALPITGSPTAESEGERAEDARSADKEIRANAALLIRSLTEDGTLNARSQVRLEVEIDPMPEVAKLGDQQLRYQKTLRDLTNALAQVGGSSSSQGFSMLQFSQVTFRDGRPGSFEVQLVLKDKLGVERRVLVHSKIATRRFPRAQSLLSFLSELLPRVAQVDPTSGLVARSEEIPKLEKAFSELQLKYEVVCEKLAVATLKVSQLESKNQELAMKANDKNSGLNFVQEIITDARELLRPDENDIVSKSMVEAECKRIEESCQPRRALSCELVKSGHDSMENARLATLMAMGPLSEDIRKLMSDVFAKLLVKADFLFQEAESAARDMTLEKIVARAIRVYNRIKSAGQTTENERQGLARLYELASIVMRRGRRQEFLGDFSSPLNCFFRDGLITDRHGLIISDLAEYALVLMDKAEALAQIGQEDDAILDFDHALGIFGYDASRPATRTNHVRQVCTLLNKKGIILMQVSALL